MHANRNRITVAVLLSIMLFCGITWRHGVARAEEYEGAPDDSAALPVETIALGAESDPIPDNGIPVLTLTIDPEEYQKVIDSPRHDYRAYGGSIRIDVPEGYTGEFSEAELESLENESLEYLRGRGNSSWNSEKKPFKLKLNRSTDLLGMGKSKHWVLLSNMGDPSLLRNRLTAYIARALGMEFVPAMTPVDFVINGEYQGSYVLSHEVRIGKNAVNIDELGDDDLAEPELTGGYLLALHPYDDEADVNKFQTQHQVDFLFDEPDFSEADDTNQDALEAQRAYITAYLQRTEDAIFGEGFSDADGIPYSDYLDLDSTASYWWIQEFSSNTDAYRTSSTYLYKKRGGKLYFGPVWDFDMAYDYSEDELSSLNTATAMAWVDHVRGHDPAFQQLLRERWDELDQVLLDITRTGGILDQYAQEIEASWESNYNHWSPLYPVRMDTYDEAISSLRDNIDARRAAINACVDEALDDVFCTVTFVVEGDVAKAVEIKQGEPLLSKDFPEEPHKDGYWFYRWETEDGIGVEPYARFSEDVVVSAVLIPDEEVIRPDLIAFPLYEQWIDINQGTWLPDYALRPYFLQDESLSWSSSNSEIAEVDVDGLVSPRAVGTATITCVAANGVSSSLELHVFDSNDTPLEDATSLELEADSLTLHPGQYGQVRVAVGPQPTTAALTYESSDEDVADVSRYGVVEGVGIGTCTIVVRDTVSGLEATYRVTVVEPSGNDPTNKEEEPSGRDEPNPHDTNRETGTGSMVAPSEKTESGTGTARASTTRANTTKATTSGSTTTKAVLPRTGDDARGLTDATAISAIVGLLLLGGHLLYSSARRKHGM